MPTDGTSKAYKASKEKYEKQAYSTSTALYKKFLKVNKEILEQINNQGN